MARFSIFHYLFAIVVVLALVANARPTTFDPDIGNVAGMPGMPTTKHHVNGQNEEAEPDIDDSEEEYMQDMKKALKAAAEAASKATPTPAGPRPTPGVATTTAAPNKATASTRPSAQASPAASTPAAKPNVLSNLPVLSGLLGGLA